MVVVAVGPGMVGQRAKENIALTTLEPCSLSPGRSGGITWILFSFQAAYPPPHTYMSQIFDLQVGILKGDGGKMKWSGSDFPRLVVYIHIIE